MIGRWNAIDPKVELLEMSSPYVYSLNSPVNFIDKDGELPIYINGKTSDDSERGAAIYWNTQLLRTIANSGIPNPGGTVHYVDGNRYLYRLANDVRVKNSGMIEGQTAEGRREAGYKIGKEDFQNILSQLARDPKSGKITEKIQIYTHSRGAAFGAGYTDALLEMIKQNSSQFADANHVIDYILNMAPHQSDAIVPLRELISFLLIIIGICCQEMIWEIILGLRQIQRQEALACHIKIKLLREKLGPFCSPFKKVMEIIIS